VLTGAGEVGQDVVLGGEEDLGGLRKGSREAVRHGPELRAGRRLVGAGRRWSAQTPPPSTRRGAGPGPRGPAGGAPGTLPGCSIEGRGQGFLEAQVGVGGDEAHAAQTAADEGAQECRPGAPDSAAATVCSPAPPAHPACWWPPRRGGRPTRCAPRRAPSRTGRRSTGRGSGLRREAALGRRQGRCRARPPGGPPRSCSRPRRPWAAPGVTRAPWGWSGLTP